MTDDLTRLVVRVQACIEDAIRPEPIPGYGDMTRAPDWRIVCLANGLRAIVDGLRTLADQEKQG